MNHDTLRHYLQPSLALMRKAKRPAAAIMVGLCCYHITTGLWFALASSSFTAAPVTPQRSASGERWAWFSSTTKPAVAPQQAVQESRLKATLLGIVQRSSGSIAIIDTGQRNDSKVFKEGDQLNRSTTVHAIEANRVLINERGVISSLTMATKRSPDINATPGDDSDTPLNSLLPNNLHSALFAGISFSQTETGETGMRLGSINPKLLAETPLQADDIVLSVGGTPIDQILNSPTSYQSLLQLDNIDLTIMRDGNEESVAINPRSLTPNIMRLIATQNR